MSGNYEPSKWVVLQITQGRAVLFYKILAGWPSGFDTDWRLNSGITKCEETEEGDWLFHGESNSVYLCKQEDYGFTNASLSVFEKLRKIASTELQGSANLFTTLTLMPEHTNWKNLTNEKQIHRSGKEMDSR